MPRAVDRTHLGSCDLDEIPSGRNRDLEQQADRLLEGTEGVLTASQLRHISYKEVQRPAKAEQDEPTIYHCRQCKLRGQAMAISHPDS